VKLCIEGQNNQDLIVEEQFIFLTQKQPQIISCCGKTLETTEIPHLSPSSYISHDWPWIPGQKFGVNKELLRRFLAGPDKARS
jgi:hypothetical protein